MRTRREDQGQEAASTSNEDGQPSPRPAVVLLGASNLTRGISTVIATARSLVGQPLDVLAALGHGRSYGAESTVLFRSLPGIVECGLWRALRALPRASAFALLTDVGNDIPGGVSVDTIAGWVEWCLDALAQVGARTVLTPLPGRSIEKLGPLRYHAFRTALFPGSRLSLAAAIERVRELNARLREIARDRGIALQELDPAWYGIDPIHIRIRFWRKAWGGILSPWAEGLSPTSLVRGSFTRWLRLRCTRANRWRLFGLELGRPQPALRLRDGTTVSLY